jgi:hypothetical protein
MHLYTVAPLFATNSLARDVLSILFNLEYLFRLQTLSP